MSIDKCEKATDLPWDLFPGNVMLKYPFWNIDFLFITEDSKSESKTVQYLSGLPYECKHIKWKNSSLWI